MPVYKLPLSLRVDQFIIEAIQTLANQTHERPTTAAREALLHGLKALIAPESQSLLLQGSTPFHWRPNLSPRLAPSLTADGPGIPATTPTTAPQPVTQTPLPGPPAPPRPKRLIQEGPEAMSTPFIPVPGYPMPPARQRPKGLPPGQDPTPPANPETGYTRQEYDALTQAERNELRFRSTPQNPILVESRNPIYPPDHAHLLPIPTFENPPLVTYHVQIPPLQMPDVYAHDFDPTTLTRRQLANLTIQEIQFLSDPASDPYYRKHPDPTDPTFDHTQTLNFKINDAIKYSESNSEDETNFHPDQISDTPTPDPDLDHPAITRPDLVDPRPHYKALDALGPHPPRILKPGEYIPQEF